MTHSEGLPIVLKWNDELIFLRFSVLVLKVLTPGNPLSPRQTERLGYFVFHSLLPSVLTITVITRLFVS